MAWQENMQKGSFRGIPFFTTKSDGQIGRRHVVNEYPQRDEAYIEDLGLKARTFTLDCFVLGPDYMTARDALEAAFEKPGPGELIHPWRGRMTVSVTDCRPSESIDQGGRQSWSVTFTQTGKNVQPSIRPDTQSLVNSAANNAVVSVENDFSETFTIDDNPEYVQADAIDDLNTKMDSILSQARAMIPDMTILPAFTAQAGGILNKAAQLMRIPTNLATQITSQINGLLGLSDSPLSAFTALTSLFGLSHQSVNRTTASRIQQNDNRAAMANLMRRTAVIEAARASSTMEFDNRTEAIAVKDTIVDAIENEQYTASDDVFNSLSDLRVAVINDIHARANNLARLIPYTPKATMPAAVLAYYLHGDATKEAELITRNKIDHPSFVVGGRTLEILTDD